MKLIEAVIMPTNLKKVKRALQAIGIETIMERKLICHCWEMKESLLSRGTEFMMEFVDKVKLEIIADECSVGKIRELIRTSVKTEQKEDCRISIYPYVEAN